MKAIYTAHAPKPAGHYVQAMVHNNLVYVSGQLPIDPQTGERRTATIEDQTRQALKNVSEVIRAAGSDMDRVIKTTVYIANIELWARVNKVYAEFFGKHKPTRAVVPTKELHFGFQIEIEAVAALPDRNARYAASSLQY